MELNIKMIFKFINRALKIKLDSKEMCNQYPLFIILYNKHKHKQSRPQTTKPLPKPK